MPRFALDYVIASGVTIGGSIMFVTRSLSEDDVTVASVGARPDGSTVLGRRARWLRIPVRRDLRDPATRRAELCTRHGGSYDSTDVDGNAIEFSQNTHYFDLNLEALAVISPVEHIAIMAGPYLDLGLGGKHKVEQDGTEIDSRNAESDLVRSRDSRRRLLLILARRGR